MYQVQEPTVRARRAQQLTTSEIWIRQSLNQISDVVWFLVRTSLNVPRRCTNIFILDFLVHLICVTIYMLASLAKRSHIQIFVLDFLVHWQSYLLG